MDPIFEVAVDLFTREVRVGEAAYPTFRATQLLGRSCRPAMLVEAPTAVGERHGWTRRFDVEHARKLRYQKMGAELAAVMEAADEEGAERLAEAERQAARQAASDQHAREEAERAEAERQAVEAPVLSEGETSTTELVSEAEPAPEPPSEAPAAKGKRGRK